MSPCAWTLLCTALVLTQTAVFAAAPRIVISSPHGGEFYIEGQQQVVQVTSRLKRVTVELSRDGGSTFTPLGVINAAAADLNARTTLTWTVSAPVSSTCMIRVSSGVFSATSGMFAIIPQSAAAQLSNSGGGSPPLVVTSGQLADASVTNPKLATLAVSSDKISSGQASPNFVLSADGNGGATWSMLPAVTSAAPSGPASGDLSGSYPGPVIVPGAVTGAKIANHTIAGSNLATNIQIATTGDIATQGGGQISAAGLLTAGNGLTVNGSVTLPANSVADSALSGNVALLDQAQTFTNSITINPGASNVTGLTVRQTSAASPQNDVFTVTDSAGTTNFLRVDKFGNTSVSGTLSGDGSGLTNLNAGNLSSIVPIANGGTGAATQQSALNALAGTVAAGKFLRGDGTNVTLSSIQASDVPTLNQNTTGTAANVTGTVAIANGGTGAANQQSALNALAGSVAAAKFLRGDGTNVTLSSIQASDVPTLNQNTTGTAANVTGTVAVANGGTGAVSLGTSRQPILGNGTSAFTAASAPTTNDALADVMIGTSATTQKGLVIQEKASQTASIAEFQDSTGAVLSMVDPSGRFSVGGNVSSYFGNNYELGVMSNGTPRLGIAGANDTPGNRPSLQIMRSRGTLAARTAVQNNDQIGEFAFLGYDGSGNQLAAMVQGLVDGAPSAGAVPMRLSFITGSNVGTRAERLQVKNDGQIIINASGAAAAGTKLLQIKSSAGQTGNLQEWQNSSGTALSTITKDGKLTVPGSGAAACAGTATLAAGTVTVSTTVVTASSIIMVCYKNTPTNPGSLYISTITAGTSFIIKSTSATDTSTVNWWIVN